MDRRVEIRPEVAEDAAAVYDVERAAFDGPVQAGLVEVLREEADPQLSLVAALDDRIVGHIFFSPVVLEAGPPCCQLSPVAVEPEHQGRGIGAALVRAGVEACPIRGWEAVFLVGNPVYYRRFGFEMAGPRGFACGGPHGPALQVLELRRGALAGAAGHVAFHPAFDALE